MEKTLIRVMQYWKEEIVMKKYVQCVFLAVLFLAFLGCDTGFSHPSDLYPTNPPPTNPPPSSLSPKTIIWERGTDGFYQFYTNDPQYLRYGFGVLFNNNNKNIYEIEIKKVSGARNIAYGMVFAAVDSENNYFVNISVDGHYLIGKCEKNYDTIFQDWTGSSRLLTGFNALNTIRVTKSGSTFQVDFNGYNVAEFTDSSIRGSGIGAYAYIGSSEDESFPNIPVEVKCRPTSP
jgi:hypothetical protein